jgi:hypothetical protein
MDEPTPEVALRDIAPRLQAMGVRFALVGASLSSRRPRAPVCSPVNAFVSTSIPRR